MNITISTSPHTAYPFDTLAEALQWWQRHRIPGEATRCELHIDGQVFGERQMQAISDALGESYINTQAAAYVLQKLVTKLRQDNDRLREGHERHIEDTDYCLVCEHHPGMDGDGHHECPLDGVAG